MAKANVANTLVVPVETTVAPYFDDFDETKNFHRILFRPGYAVQARELTQLQTIMQNQIERFGRHIFVNGSSVIGGDLDITNITTLNLQSEFANTAINVDDFKNKTIRNLSGNTEILARVVQVSPANDTEPPALHIKYLSGTEFTNGDTITTSDYSSNAALALANASSTGTLAFMYDSIYFLNGYFIKVPSQAAAVSKYNTVFSTKIGLELDDSVITELSDTSLLDPALESSNYQAPGAARYKIDLVLAGRPLDSEDDEKFIEVARIENGIVKKQVRNPIYSEIEEVFARRTYDESGNYTVKPFQLMVEDSINDSANNFSLSLSSGKAYLYGYEIEIPSETRIEIPRATETRSIGNYNLNLNYGNYVIVEDLEGAFNTRYGLVDLHCVSKDLIDTSSTGKYNSTKIGTARIRDLEYFSGDVDIEKRKFELYFVDTKFTALTGTAGGLVDVNNKIDLNSANAATITNAYANAIVSLVGGKGSGDIRQIVSYDGARKVATVSPPFSETIDSTTQYKIAFDITDVDSFIQSTTYTEGATTPASATISTICKIGGTLDGDTVVFEPNRQTALFPYPKSYVTPGITGAEYTYRKTFSGVQFIDGISAVLTAGTDENFLGATSSLNISSTVNDNWIVIVTDPQNSSRQLGEQVLITTEITGSVPEQATLFTNDETESFIATVYTKIKVTDSATTPRVKSLVLANTKTFTTDSVSATFNNSTGSTTNVYLNAGQVVITNPSATEFENLYISDVINAVKIYYVGTDYPTANSTLEGVATDVTNRYVIDNGQTPYSYDHAKIRLKSGFSNPVGHIVVCLRYYKNTNDVGYFSVDSYPSLNSTVIEEGVNIGTGYSLIPRVGNVKLSDVIDFRPVRQNATNTESQSFTSVRTPIATTDFTSDFSYYLPRKDIVVLNLDKSLQLIRGKSSERPAYPEQPERSLLLHRLDIDPYTETTRNIEVESLNHRRYTMKDISNIDRRLKNVEYSVSLNTLEKSAIELSIKDVNGLDRTKYGILAENFNSHLLGDQASPDYACAVDLLGKYTPKEGMLAPQMKFNEIKLVHRSSLADKISIHDDKILLQYTTKPAISQTSATKTAPVNEYLFADFRGTIFCRPEADIWKNITYLPPIIIDPPVTPTPNTVDTTARYAVALPTSVFEGANVTAVVSTLYVQNGTTLYWEILNGNTSNSDFVTTNGSFTISTTSNSATSNLVIQTLDDALTENVENFRVIIKTNLANTTNVAISNLCDIEKSDDLVLPDEYYYIYLPETVYEGSNVGVTISTNAPNNSIVYWSVLHGNTSPADFVSTNGQITIANGAASFEIPTVEDNLTEGTQNFKVRIRKGSATGPIPEGGESKNFCNILDVPKPTPVTYSVSIQDIVYEGTSAVGTVVTTGVANNTVLYWAVASGYGNTNIATDFTTNTGSVNIVNNRGSFFIPIATDGSIEGVEIFRVDLKANSTTGTTVATSANCAIIDTTVPIPTYSVNVSTPTYEGSNATATVSTSNVNSGTTLYWTIQSGYGNTTSADFATTNGSFTVTNSFGTFNIPTINDGSVEGSENFRVEIRTSSISGNIVANSANSTIVDLPIPVADATYAAYITPSINEGASAHITVSANNVPNGNVVYWAVINGNTADADFGATTGTATITSNTTTFSIITAANAVATVGGTENFTVQIRIGSASGTIVANTGTCNIIDVPVIVPTYNTSIVSSVTEGSNAAVTVQTTNVSDNTTLYWTVLNDTTTSQDFVATSGNVVINNGLGNFFVRTATDAIIETEEKFRVQIRTTSIAGPVVNTTNYCTLVNTTVPSYNIVLPSSVSEGANATATVTTANVAIGTVLYWDVSHVTTSANDFVSTTGTYTVSSNVGTFLIPTASDAIALESESFKVNLRTTNNSGPIVATSANCVIIDTSSEPPAYNVTAVGSTPEGSSVGCRVSTKNVPDGTVLYWTIRDDTTTFADFESITGTVTISGNAASFSIPTTPGTVADNTESTETFYVQLRSGGRTGTVLAESTIAKITNVIIAEPAPVPVVERLVYEVNLNGETFTLAGMSAGQFYNFIRSKLPGLSVSTAVIDQIYYLYLSYLSRPPQEGGILYWISQATRNNLNTREIDLMVVNGGINSGEFAAPFVLGNNTRTLTPTVIFTGTDFKYGPTSSFASIDYRTSSIFNGAYSSIGGNTRDLTPQQFITELYETLLKRAPDTAGFNYWYNEFSAAGFSAESAYNIIKSFVASSDYKKKYGLS